MLRSAIGLYLVVVIANTVFAQGKKEPEQMHAAFWEPQNSGLQVSLRGVCAVSAEIVWISGAQGSYATTTDGGKSWHADSVGGSRPAGIDFRDVYAVDARTAYLMSAGPGELSRIYKTTDAGKTWHLQYTNTLAAGFFDGMAFGDADRGVVVGDPVDGRLFLLYTHDGGAHWQRLPAEKLPPVLDGEYGFAASGTGIAVAGKNNIWIGTGGTASRVFFSNDGGQSWAVANTPIVSGQQSAGIFSLAFRDARHGIAVGGDYQQPEAALGNLAATSDGGKTWRLIENVGTIGYRSCVAYARRGSATVIVVVGTSGASYSMEDGKTWIAIAGSGYNAVNFSPTGAGWAVGANGNVAKFHWPDE